jgi:hypothetical protein
MTNCKMQGHTSQKKGGPPLFLAFKGGFPSLKNLPLNAPKLLQMPKKMYLESIKLQ